MHDRAVLPAISLRKALSEYFRTQCQDLPFALLADPLPEMAEITEIEGGFVLKVYLPAEMLPVGILHPVGQSAFITVAVYLLEQDKSHHGTDGYGRGTFLAVITGKILFNCAPVGTSDPSAQLVTGIDEMDQGNFRQVQLRVLIGFTQHKLYGFVTNIVHFK